MGEMLLWSLMSLYAKQEGVEIACENEEKEVA